MAGRVPVQGKNPFHRIPLILTTRDSQGRQISFMPGGPLVPTSRRLQVVECVTLDENNNEIPIPFMGNLGAIERYSTLPEAPADGLMVAVENFRMGTQGYTPTASQQVLDELFLALDLPLEDISGAGSMVISDCSFGAYTGGLNIVFLEDSSLLELGLTGPVMLIANTYGEDVTDLIYIRVSEAQVLNSPEKGFDNIQIPAGWNLLTNTNNIWIREAIEPEDIPTIEDVIVEEVVSDLASPFASTAEWYWLPSLAYSIGGSWRIAETPLPKLITSFAAYDGESAHLAAHNTNMYSLQRLANGECAGITFADICKVIAGHLNVSGYITGYVPLATAHTVEAIKAALEEYYTEFISTRFGEGNPSITIDEFTYAESGMDGLGTWNGRFIWHSPTRDEVLPEPYLHHGVTFYFTDEPGGY